MKTPAEIQAELPNFFGTEHWYQYSPIFKNVLLTDGAKYIAEECGAYWLMDAIASYLGQITDQFVIATLTRTGTKARLILADDEPANQVYATQEIEYTDFPLDTLKLYAIYDGENWVILLTSEY